MARIPEEYQAVMRTAFRILAYRDNTERVLRRKLTERKYSEEEIDFALRYVVHNGYLDEEKQLYHAIRRLADGKLYGKRRVLQELYRLGFSQETLRHAVEEGCFDGIDFIANCTEALRRAGGVCDPRTVAALGRRGFSYSDIRAAQNALDTEQSL